MINKEYCDFIIRLLETEGRMEQMKIRDRMTDKFSLPPVTIDNFMDEVKFIEQLMWDVRDIVNLRREAYSISDSIFYSLA